MINKTTPIPGHQVGGGYPFEGPITRTTWHSRPTAKLIGNINGEHKVVMSDGASVYNYIVALEKALSEVEGQVNDMLQDQPFNPLDFGFELVYKNQDIKEPPVKIYQSKFDEYITLHQPFQDVDSPEYNAAMWVMQDKFEGGTLHSRVLHLPCHRVAFHAFYALGIKIEDGAETKSLLEVANTPVTEEAVEVTKNQLTINFESESEPGDH